MTEANEQELVRLFARLGANQPETWAHSQVTEGINQLHRFLILRQLWAEIVDRRDNSWVDTLIDQARKRPSLSNVGLGEALVRLIDAGAQREDIATVVRDMQVELLFRFCYLLGDPSLEEPELGHIGWRLVETDDHFEPTDRTIDGLHESVWETDPERARK